MHYYFYPKYFVKLSNSHEICDVGYDFKKGNYLLDAGYVWWTEILLDLIWVYINNKNPAYGRHSISQPMRIVAPIPKKPLGKAKLSEI